MHEWNVVITVHDGGFNEARKLLHRFGPVDTTEYFNVLVMQLEEPRQILWALRDEGERDPYALSSLARVMPVDRAFSYMTAPEFEGLAKQAVAEWLPDLAGRSFHLRMHRRGFKGKLSSLDEEKFLDTFLLESLEKYGRPGRITFEDPDVIISLETLGPRAGMSLWNREDLIGFPLLHLD